MSKIVANYEDLRGKRFFITGASSGIGAGMARVLSQQGCDLVLHYHQNQRGIQQTLESVLAQGVKAEIVQADFRQLDQVQSVFDQAWSFFDGLDGLVNNAGVVTKSLSLKDPQGRAFQETLAINLHAPYLLSTAYVEAFLS